MGWITDESGNMQWVPDTVDEFNATYGEGNLATPDLYDGQYYDDQQTGVSDPGFMAWLSNIGGSAGNAVSNNSSLLATLGGGLLGGVGAKQTGNQVSTQAPWEAQQPYLRELFAKAQGALDTSLGMSGQEQTALEAMQQRALSGSPLQQYGSATMQNILSGSDYNPTLGVNNPYLTATINNASSDAMRNLQPMFAQQQRASGSFGNTGLAESQARTAATTLGNIATNARMGDYQNQQNLYEQDINRRMNVAGQAPQYAQSDFADMQRLYDIGQTRRFDPYSTLGKYGSLIQGQYGNVQSSPLYENKGAQILGGAIAGQGLLNAYQDPNKRQPGY